METVEDTYNIDADVLYDKGQNSEYWKSCEKFFSEVCGRALSSLTASQTKWLTKIEEDLDD